MEMKQRNLANSCCPDALGSGVWRWGWGTHSKSPSFWAIGDLLHQSPWGLKHRPQAQMVTQRQREAGQSCENSHKSLAV